MIGVTERKRELRKCKHCGYKRVVKVLVWEDTEAGKREEVFSDLCTACELDVQARTHIMRAETCRAKAREIRQKRKRTAEHE